MMNFFKPKIKVLGVDDNQTQQLLYERIFAEKHGFVYKGITGLEAFNGIKINHFDVILMDWNYRTTEDNGRDVEKFFRFEKKYLGPIIFVTANVTAVEILKKEGKMVAKKIVEPCKLSELCQNIKNLDRPTVLEKLEELSDFNPKILIPGSF